MANALTDEARGQFLNAGIDWSSDDFKVALLGDAYTFDAGHNFLDDLSDIIDTSGNLTGTATLATGAADADDTTVGAVPVDEVTQMWLYKDTGSPATSVLIAYWDEDSTETLIDVNTSGGDVLIVWDALGIFRL